jgi:alginate O-acetyltransferase complex protein AlgI
MSGLPPAPTAPGLVGSALLATLGLGLAITRLPSRLPVRGAAWGLVVFSVAGTERLVASEPPLLRMLAVTGALFFAMKAVVSVEWRLRDGTSLTPARWLAFATAWPGMRPGLFAWPPASPPSGGARLCGRGAAQLAGGVVFVLAARVVWTTTASRLAATVLLLPGLSLILHFGIFNLAAGIWRLAGVDCEPLFRAPLLTRNLREFWGRRWNRAFSEMTAVAVYRPLAYGIGRPPALLAAFLVSGLFHEVAISVPVRAGFGGPLLYFAIHAGLALIETALGDAGHGVGRRPWLGRAWTAACLLVPLPLLFHPPFLRGVLWPLIGVR